MRRSFTEAEIKKYLKANLTAEKYRHTLGVTALAVQLAGRYGAGVNRAKTAGLLHDAGKDLAKNRRYLKFVKLDRYEKEIKALRHNKLGETIARRVFKIKDRAVLSAIRKHSTADKNMGVLDKIIYIADAAERNRKFKGVQGIRKAAGEDLDRGFIAALTKKIEFILKKGKKIHPRSIEAWNRYIR